MVVAAQPSLASRKGINNRWLATMSGDNRGVGGRGRGATTGRPLAGGEGGATLPVGGTCAELWIHWNGEVRASVLHGLCRPAQPPTHNGLPSGLRRSLGIVAGARGTGVIGAPALHVRGIQLAGAGGRRGAETAPTPPRAGGARWALRPAWTTQRPLP